MDRPLEAAEFIQGYLAEAEEHLTAARASLLAIDAAHQHKARSPGAVRTLFRAVHTIKGLSAMVGAEPIVDLTHELETLLRAADKAAGHLPPRALDLIQQGLRAIEDRLGNLSRGETLVPAPKPLLEALGAIRIDAPTRSSTNKLDLAPELLLKLSPAEQEQLLQGLDAGRRAVRVDFVPSQARATEGLNITRVRERMGKLGEIVKVIPLTLPAAEGERGRVAFALLLLTDAADPAIAEAAGAAPHEVHALAALNAGVESDGFIDEPEGIPEVRERNFVRVEVKRLDDALERLSALVVTRARLERTCGALAQASGNRELSNVLAEHGRQLRDLRAAIMQARMVPVSEMLERAPLLVRGLTRSSKKLVRLTIDAGRTELDKAVSDRLFPAIVHLLRNAVDHAIEAPEERQRKGKSREGHLHVSCAERSGNQLELQISDDGRGIDREQVARRAGLPVAADDAELLAMIVRPGLSTLDKATHTSGRGLGMDIVKRIVVDQLGGKLRLVTSPEGGTRFTVTVPLSLTVLEAFSFVCGGRTFVVPVASVEALAEIAPEYVTLAPRPEAHGKAIRLFEHRGSSVPLFSLSALLGFASLEEGRCKAILMRRDSEVFGFEVERMLGKQEIVVRPLTDPLVSVDGVTGSTDLGDGQPTLVIDPLALVRSTEALQVARA
jgi:two-component system chemotaxis sensor kinase CheA